MTIEELSKLSDEELRVRCAELCGWKRNVRKMYAGERSVQGWEKGGEFTKYGGAFPNYPADLNACREVVRTLTETQRERFVSILCSMSGTAEYDAFEWAICDAEARHITIAFIAAKQPSAQDGRGR